MPPFLEKENQMSAVARDVRTLWAMVEFFVAVYLTYVCMYVGPTDHLRRWGARTWWWHFRVGPVWPT
jgi:hypothetical protein